MRSQKNFEADQLPFSSTAFISLQQGLPEVLKNENEEERRRNHKLFYENAWLLYENAETIMTDSKMFFAPVRIQNHLAYTGVRGFRNPTVGVYVEWWREYEKAAIDANGNLLWYVSGSPLSGCNCCQSVTREGKSDDIAQRTQFKEIWQSFTLVNTRYSEAKQNIEAYTLEEVIAKLKALSK